MIGNWIALVFEDFGMGMFILALVCIAIDAIIHLKFSNIYEIIFKWTALLPLGLTGLYTFFVHAFFPAVSANSIGWPQSPFQFEVAMADLALGVLGILCFKANFGFRFATTIAAVICLWGDAVGHIYQMLFNKNFSAGNAGSWFWLDILVPLILVICLKQMRRSPALAS